MIGSFIQKIRERNNYTQDYVASKLGMSRPTYIAIEKEERDVSLTEAKLLADIFGISLEDLLAHRVPAHRVELEKEGSKPPETLQIRVNRKNLKKFKQVILYILNEVGGKPNVGETVLHKLLYFIDFDYYEKYEENLMGATYIKNHHGPTSVELGEILKDMEKHEEIEAVRSKYFKYPQKKYLARMRPDLAGLSAQEIEHIDEVLARLSDKNAKEIENYSHGDIPWKTAQDGKVLSYESVFYRDERYSVRNYEDEL